ncbi:RecQ family ATP-dependent DNA helicase [Limosilactobacillus fastidiosus]|uniref:ATP-dependent DNA helicase RecQ n=1 Tax=Limosilactobacillus fastidiosus TaxID=2759855 RepID=A0A7W3YCN9_9LACO|nr:ATP-dependent DNA helicase RecQ [Limosilactobacillus fastidiosus]MBB1062757.1 ATP-dependent DNA helicase RecQ [Limosilactobacillus fastidiosus]MBB1086508.1 ATP-dependent DNA helicase RecQ [Limosilactobacillus fastidiosus]MCD7084830.1 ATP-dependent DNA helicase [Limosilactobacillus fastidiosus]MCD7085140.1 ATP-dependent DNA helicase [Limosilactobacillus fastidiosus]MCD7115096.1 ATP-dependent DNA helicase [Limosilactobacillus fastidiosus]
MISDHQLLATLNAKFGFSSFRDGQEETVKAVLKHRDTLAVLPTGGGKSLLYQLPGYLLPGCILIVSPLISLMQDQVERLHRSGEKRVLMINSQLTGKSRQQAMRQLPSFKFIFTSPESLTNPDIIQALKKVKISLFVVDEAHCISQWGPDFRPEYLLLSVIRQNLDSPTTLLLTATATPEVRQDIIQKMGLENATVTQVIRSVNRPNIYYAVKRFLSAKEKEQSLIELVSRLAGPGIIYFASRKLASQFAEKLNKKTDKNVAAYHAGIAPLDRYRLQQQFMENQIQLICATSAFGMGIDKEDIRFVIHFHEPANLESYVQEVGRAGRDGQPSLALLLYCPGDEQIQRTLNHIDLPESTLLEAVRNKHQPASVLGDNHELFSFYLKHGYDGKMIIKAFKKRQRNLSSRLEWMAHYINNTKMCRRKMILGYFGEQLEQPQEPCCDITEPTLIQRFEHHNNETINGQQVSTKLDWQERLYQLLNINHDKEN